MHLEDGLSVVPTNGGDRAEGLLLCRWVGAVHNIRRRHSTWLSVGTVQPLGFDLRAA
jgi:hypothetical protein